MRSLLSLTLLTLSISAHAQVIDLKDSNPSLAPIGAGFNMGIFKNKIIWTTAYANNGNLELHMYQGGTDNKLLEINKPAGGFAYSFPVVGSYPVIDGKMYFPYQLDSIGDYRLCSWDGVTDPVFLNPNYDSRDAQKSVALDNKICFIHWPDYVISKVTMYDPVSFTYQTLPTSLDTAQSLIPFNGKLYFFKDLSNWGRESPFYVYDPATNGVSPVSGSGIDYGTPVQIVELNNRLYFIAPSKPGTTLGLYEYDGNSAPKKISGSLRVSAPAKISDKYLGLYNGEIYFSADTLMVGKNLYKYDPHSKSGTLSYIHTFYTYPSSNFVVQKDRLVFVAPGTPGPTAEIWQYDGVRAPSLLADINGVSAGSSPTSLIAANETVYFIANGSSGTSIYRLSGGLDVLELAHAIEAVKLDPNPATDVVSISFNLKKNAIISAVISDMTGKEVYRLAQQATAGPTSLLLDINSLIPGNYTYRLIGIDNKVYARGKFVKN